MADVTSCEKDLGCELTGATQYINTIMQYWPNISIVRAEFTRHFHLSFTGPSAKLIMILCKA